MSKMIEIDYNPDEKTLRQFGWIALVGFGSIYEDVVVTGGAIRAAKFINMTLAADHRASDGHRGALFLNSVHRLLQKPEKL